MYSSLCKICVQREALAWILQSSIYYSQSVSIGEFHIFIRFFCLCFNSNMCNLRHFPQLFIFLWTTVNARDDEKQSDFISSFALLRLASHGFFSLLSCNGRFLSQNYILFILNSSSSMERVNYKRHCQRGWKKEKSLFLVTFERLNVHHIVYDIASIYFYDSLAFTRMVQCHLENLSKCLLRIWHLTMMLLMLLFIGQDDMKERNWMIRHFLSRFFVSHFYSTILKRKFNMMRNDTDYCSHHINEENAG